MPEVAAACFNEREGRSVACRCSRGHFGSRYRGYTPFAVGYRPGQRRDRHVDHDDPRERERVEASICVPKSDDQRNECLCRIGCAPRRRVPSSPQSELSTERPRQRDRRQRVYRAEYDLQPGTDPTVRRRRAVVRAIAGASADDDVRAGGPRYQQQSSVRRARYDRRAGRELFD